MLTRAGSLWPFFGRDDEIATTASSFGRDDVGGIILRGDAGIGKTALATEIASTLPSHRLVRISANPALARVPYGAIAHEIPADGVDASGEVDRAVVLRSLSGAERRTVVVVDDPSELDEGTLGIIAQLVTSGGGFLVATVRSDATVPPAFVALERTGGVRRIDVGPLGHQTVAVLLARVLDGPIAPSAVTSLVAASAGNPLYLRELVEQASSSGLLHVDGAGQWRLVGELVPGRRLVDVLADRIGRLPDEVRELAKIFALGAPLRWSSLERGGYGEATLELERAGVVTVHDAADPTIELAHPLHGEILRSEIKVLERRRLLGRLVDWLDTGDATIDERLRIADWQLTIGRLPKLRTLEEGARRAWSARDHAALERFATAALDQQPSLAMARLRVEALVHTGRSLEADAVAERYLCDDDGSSPRDRSRLVGLRVFNDLWYLERLDEAASIVEAERGSDLDPVADDELLILEAYVALATSDARTVLDLVEPRSWTPAVAPQGLLLTAQMMADSGRTLDGLATVRAAAVATNDEEAMTVSTPGSIDAATVRLTILAGDLDGADRCIAEFSERPEYRSDPFIRGHLLLSAGRVALLRGRPATARECFAEGRVVGEEHDNRVATMGCTAGLAVAAAYLRDTTACRVLYDELESYQMARVVRPSIAAGMAWTLAALGEPARARELLVAETEHSLGRVEIVDAVMLASDLARLGDPSATRDLLDDRTPVIDGLAALLHEACRAFAGSSPDELAMAERRAVDAGLLLLGSELAAAGARALRRKSDGRAAAAAQLRSSDLLERCEGASTPGTVVTESVTPLSNREREIAVLAAAGLSNQDIADRLFVSVRTIGNHLQNAYVKLGVSGRAELADVLGH